MSEQTVKKIKDRFGDKVQVLEKSKTRVYVDARDKELAIEVVKFLFKDLGLRFSIASGVDKREGIEILYHMADDKNGTRISIRTLAEKPYPEMPSATSFMDGAEWIEREMHELLGVDFIGHPNQERLLLPDDWPDGIYPLRKGQ